MITNPNTIGIFEREMAQVAEAVHEKGFKGIVCFSGGPALALARQYRPSAITLDVNLPDVSGWKVLEALKNDPEVRHIPVHLITAEKDRLRGLREGAFDLLSKSGEREPLLLALENLKEYALRKTKDVLLIEDEETDQADILNTIGNGTINKTVVGTGMEAIVELEKSSFDCIVLDLMLPDMSGFDVLERIGQMERHKMTPVIVYTARNLTREEDSKLRKVAKTIITKSAHSRDRLLYELTLFLHLVHAQMPGEKQKAVERMISRESTIVGKTILVVDDDIRNIFALTGVLETNSMNVLTAESGRQALQVLDAPTSPVDAILMDIMMPEMDGYETMREIRKNPKYASLPIIAVTAKVMKGDREKCIESGASDYIPKPVDINKLLSLLRVWIPR